MLISTGRGETPMPAAAATATGIMIRAVAVLLISWPMIAVTTNRPASSASGPASPTSLTSQSASMSAAPDSTIAVESGIIAPTRITVVQSMAR